MKRQTIAAIGAAGLLAAFVGAMAIYERRQVAEVAAAGARYDAPPFVREYSQTLGSEDARVVLVEFFDPG